MRKHIVFLLLLCVGGCGAQQLTQGEPNFNTAILLPSPAAASRDPAKLGLTPAQPPPECTAAAADVDKCVYAVKAIIDDQYREYRITLHHLADDGNAAADIGVLGLTTAATSPVSTAAKTILSGLGTVLGGSKTILNQDLLYKQTIEIVINQMDADRNRQFTLMLAEMNGGKYTLEQAKDDLLAYFAAGTWDHAVTSLQSKTAANQANCAAQADAAKLAKSQSPTDGTAGAAAAASNPAGCLSAEGTGAAAISSADAIAGSTFQAANGLGIYKVTGAMDAVTGKIAVAYAPDGKTYVSLPPMAFSAFAVLVKAPAAKSP